MREESIPETLTLTGPLDQPSNIGDIKEGGNLAGRFMMLNQPVEPLVRDRDPADRIYI